MVVISASPRAGISCLLYMTIQTMRPSVYPYTEKLWEAAMDPIVSRSLLALAVGVALILLGIVLAPPA
jgi:hypothetical protein